MTTHTANFERWRVVSWVDDDGHVNVEVESKDSTPVTVVNEREGDYWRTVRYTSQAIEEDWGENG